MEIKEGGRSAASARTVPVAANLSLAAMHLLMSLYLLLFLPLFLMPLNPRWSVTIFPVVLLSNPFWSLIHEAIHDLFHPVSRINAASGRLLSVFFGSPFRVLRLSHLMHHKFNRTPLEGTELYDPERRSRFRAAPGYYFQILGGLYLLEFISPLIFFLPRRLLRDLVRRFFAGETLGGILFRSLMGDGAIREMRTDGLAVFALFGLSAFCYGEYWGLLVAALAVRAFLISFLDNVYHYRTPVNDVFYANNLRLSRPLARMLLHFNLHGVHHRNTTVPWIKLPEVFGRESAQFGGDYFVAAVGQLWGPASLSELPQWRPAADRAD